MNTPESFETGHADELQALRRVLDASAPETPLDELTRERLRHAAREVRRHRRQQRLALAASVALLLSGIPLLTLRDSRPPPPMTAAHPLIQDPLLTEMDLLDLRLIELTQSLENDTLFPTLEELL